MIRYVVGASLLAAAYILGRVHGTSGTVVEERVVVREVAGETTERVVYRDRIVEKVVEKRPDGTEIVRETLKESDGSTDRDITTTEKGSTREVVADSRTQWRAGIDLRLDPANYMIPLVEGRVGYRLGGNVWIELSGTREDISLGVSVEWN